MGTPTAEQFAQRAFNLGLLTEQQLDSLWGEFRRRDVPLDDFCNLVLRRELLTNYQVERIIRGERSGFFYGDYKVLYLVGTGSFARVFRAVHKQTGEVVAVKVLRRRFSDDPAQTEHFLHEGKVGSRLRHENIVPIYEVCSDSTNHYFLVMEFVEGWNLREFVRIRKKLSPLESTKLMIHVVSGLAHAFKMGLAHRDLKMSNVLVSSRGTAKLVDFGLADYSAELNDESMAECPNPRSIDYAALERRTGVRRDDERSDIYFAGTIYYHMLSGHPALHETKDRIQRLSTTRFDEVLPITHYLPSLARPVVAVVNRAMELNPTRRYSKPSEMLADLISAERQLAEGGTAEEVSERAESANEEEPATKSALGLEGLSHTVMVVESNVAMQDILRERLKKRGYRVLVIGDVERALNRFIRQDDAASVDCAVFSTNELGEEAVDAFNRFGDISVSKNIPAILLLDKKRRGLREKAELAEHRVAVTMPIRLKEFRAVLKKLVRMHASS